MFLARGVARLQTHPRPHAPTISRTSTMPANGALHLGSPDNAGRERSGGMGTAAAGAYPGKTSSPLGLRPFGASVHNQKSGRPSGVDPLTETRASAKKQKQKPNLGIVQLAQLTTHTHTVFCVSASGPMSYQNLRRQQQRPTPLRLHKRGRPNVRETCALGDTKRDTYGHHLGLELGRIQDKASSLPTANSSYRWNTAQSIDPGQLTGTLVRSSCAPANNL